MDKTFEGLGNVSIKADILGAESTVSIKQGVCGKVTITVAPTRHSKRQLQQLTRLARQAGVI